MWGWGGRGVQKPTQLPKIKLSRLRDIGWSIWDPIGLMEPGKNWEDEECRPFADEYDGYLMQAVGQLRRGTPPSEVIKYLMMIETEHMGLGEAPDSIRRAELVVAAIQADKLLWRYPAKDV
jgi:hypothetical protein